MKKFLIFIILALILPHLAFAGREDENDGCRQGFVWNGTNSYCGGLTSNGSTYLENLRKCFDNYRYDPVSDGCVKCPEEYAACNLAYYNRDTGEPISYWNEVYCYDEVENCSTCDYGSGGTYCLSCLPAYTMAHYGTSGTCEPCRYSECLDCSEDINSCKKCKEGYTLGGDGFCYSDTTSTSTFTVTLTDAIVSRSNAFQLQATSSSEAANLMETSVKTSGWRNGKYSCTGGKGTIVTCTCNANYFASDTNCTEYAQTHKGSCASGDGSYCSAHFTATLSEQTPATISDTINGNCPTGTTKSSDGCCCIKN